MAQRASLRAGGRSRGWWHLPVLAMAVSGVAARGAVAQTASNEGDEIDALIDELIDLDIDELMQVQVTSVAGRAQTLLDTPAAIFVITQEDIRRSGHRSLAEMLRIVPGFTAAQVSPSIWAVGSRGLVDRFANDLLVLIDGRTVYDPLFSGVFWNVQDVLLEDVDRIEVIRGPGATLWGANAVNGVVNVTTKSAAETQGLYVTGGGGNLDQGFAAFRYGGEIDEDTHFRVWGKYDNHASFDTVAGVDAGDGWDLFHGGFRMDHVADDRLAVTLQGDLYTTGSISEFVRVPVPGNFTFVNSSLDEEYNGGNVLFRVGREESETRGWAVQTYYDRTKTRGGQPGFEVRRDTFDVDYRQYRPLGDEGRHVLMWGLGYRHSRDRTEAGPTLTFDPRSRSLDTFTGFIQDTMTLVPDRLHLMVGSKLEHNDFTGFEIQPSGRISWTPDDRQTLWGAVSRAVRDPSRIADDTILTTTFADSGLLAGGPASGVFVPLQLLGDSGVDAEELLSYELGYRVRLSDALSFDVATFYNDYDNLITFPLPAGTFGNRGEANTYGVEIASTWEISSRWRLSGSYSFVKVDFESVDGNPEETETPQQQFNVRSYLDLTDDLELNSALYYVDGIPDEGVGSYFRLDVGLTWRPTPNMEIAVWGQNLLDDQHPEFGDDLFQAAPLEIDRSFYVQVSLRF